MTILARAAALGPAALPVASASSECAVSARADHRRRAAPRQPTGCGTCDARPEHPCQSHRHCSDRASRDFEDPGKLPLRHAGRLNVVCQMGRLAHDSSSPRSHALRASLAGHACVFAASAALPRKAQAPAGRHPARHRCHDRADALRRRRRIASRHAPGAARLGLGAALRVAPGRGVRQRRHGAPGVPVSRGLGRSRRRRRLRVFHDANAPEAHPGYTMHALSRATYRRLREGKPDSLQIMSVDQAPARRSSGRLRLRRRARDAGALARHNRAGHRGHRALPGAAQRPPGAVACAPPARRFHRPPGPVAAGALGARRQHVSTDPQVDRRRPRRRQRAPDDAHRSPLPDRAGGRRCRGRRRAPGRSRGTRAGKAAGAAAGAGADPTPPRSSASSPHHAASSSRESTSPSTARTSLPHRTAPSRRSPAFSRAMPTGPRRSRGTPTASAPRRRTRRCRSGAWPRCARGSSSGTR